MKGSMKWRILGAGLVAALIVSGVVSPQVGQGLQFVLDVLTGVALPPAEM